MRFQLVDKVLELHRGKRIVTVKNLTMAEEYLAEHFPGFPVLPGVLMVEAVTQSAGWLIRATHGFTHSLITLKELKAVRFGHFLSPGRQMTIECDWVSEAEIETDKIVTVKATSSIDGTTAIAGRFVLNCRNLSAKESWRAEEDQRIRERQRYQLAGLWRVGAAELFARS